jgi:hypothetical protein
MPNVWGVNATKVLYSCMDDHSHCHINGHPGLCPAISLVVGRRVLHFINNSSAALCIFKVI